MAIADFFTSIFYPIMGLSYFMIILIVSLLATAITTVIYKYATDQKKMKRLKGEIKELRKKVNENKNDQKKMMKIQQEMMGKNAEMMKQSFKPMLFTFIPLIIFFSWMSATLAYQPIMPGQPFTVTATLADTYTSNLSNITLASQPAMNITRDEAFSAPSGSKEVRFVATPQKTGTYTLVINGPGIKETKDVLVTTQKQYVSPTKQYSDSQLKQVAIGNNPVRPLAGVPVIGGFDWLWTYIVLSIVISMVLRKVFDIA